MTVTPCPPPADLSYLETPAQREQSLALSIAQGVPLEESMGALYDAYRYLGCSPAYARQLAWTDFVCESLL